MGVRLRSARVQAFLYHNNNQDSLEAIERLRKAGIKFEELVDGEDVYIDPRDTEWKLPTLDALEGEFDGLERINDYIHLVKNRPVTN